MGDFCLSDPKKLIAIASSINAKKDNRIVFYQKAKKHAIITKTKKEELQWQTIFLSH